MNTSVIQQAWLEREKARNRVASLRYQYERATPAQRISLKPNLNDAIRRSNKAGRRYRELTREEES